MIGILLDLPSDPMFLGGFWEAWNIIFWAIMLVYCYIRRGKWDTIKIYLIGFIYGMVLENGGPLVLPELGFEGYFWEENYQIYLFEFFGHGYRLSKVPLATHLGWCSVFFVAVELYDQICKAFPNSRLNGTVVLGGLTMSMSGWLRDLQLDPLATRFRWWVWNENLQPLWFGVPLINYIAWFWAVGVFGAFWVWLHKKQESEKWDDKTTTLRFAIFLPVMWVIDTIGAMGSKYLFTVLGLMYV